MPDADAAKLYDIRNVVKELSGGRIVPLREVRRALVQWAVIRSRGNMSSAARKLGTSRTTVYRYGGGIRRAIR